MKPPPFDYVLAKRVADVHEALAAARGAGLSAKVLAGGQSLVPLMNFRLARPDRLVDITRLDELRYIEVGEDSFRVGALCRHADVEHYRSLTERVGALADALPLVGHPSIRSRGTVAGSLAHGDPLAEWVSLALLLDASMKVSSTTRTRVVDAAGWLQGYLNTAVAEDELLEEASFRLPGGSGAGEGSAFVELAHRHGDFCLVSAAATIALDEQGGVAQARLVLAGVKALPFRATELEDALAGEQPTAETLVRVTAPLARLEAEGDLHATAAYRRQVAGVVARRALASATARARRGPA
jgi:carbon-monoxide dehydrogenase medium subunit